MRGVRAFIKDQARALLIQPWGAARCRLWRGLASKKRRAGRRCACTAWLLGREDVELELRAWAWLQVVEGLTSKTQGGETLRVREVWRDNLDDEMDIIRGIVDEYPFIAMDTEFPGVVARPVGQFKNSGEYHYQTLRRALPE